MLDQYIPQKNRLLITVICIGLLALTMRLIGIGNILTADEDRWILRSSWFWNEVSRGGFANTFMTTHPATTLMWLAGSGTFIQSYMQGLPTEIEPHQVGDFALSAKIPVVIATSLLIAIVTFCLARALNTRTALWSGIVLATEPYLTGLSQIVHLDALLSLFLLGSLSALLAYKKTCMRNFLVLSAILQGCAMATKLPPALFGILFGLFLLRSRIKHATIWVVVAVITTWALCPALWIPTNAIGNENYTSGLAASYKDDIISITTEEHIELETSTDAISAESFYLRTIVSRTTPITLLIGVVVIIAIVRQVWQHRSAPLLSFLLYAIGFLGLITFIAKKGDRYAMPALVMIAVLVGWGIGKLSPRPVRIFLGIVLFIQTLIWSPYAIAYDNNFFPIRHLSQQGWGEGLNEAAAYLNNHPLAKRGKDFYVASWYSPVLRTFFHGTTLSLSSRNDDRVAFIVTYRNMGGRGNESIATSVIEEVQEKYPVHTVFIQGTPYAWIYEQIGLRYFNRTTGELLPSQEVGQIIPNVPANWESITIGLSTFSGRNNTSDVVLHIKADKDAEKDLRTVIVNAQNITDREYHKFIFEPLSDSAGKTYYVSLTSLNATTGNAITVHYMTENTLPGTMVWREKQGDIAYRL